MPALLAALGAVVARMAFPASERATHRWLRERSAAGELLGVDFETMGAMRKAARGHSKENANVCALDGDCPHAN